MIKFRNALGERIIVKRKLKDKDPVVAVKEEVFGELYSVGEDCSDFLRNLKGENVLFAENSFESLYIEDGFEYLLLHKSAILAY